MDMRIQSIIQNSEYGYVMIKEAELLAGVID
jgi:hypothetical protein